MTWCRQCLTVATRAARSRDADESSADDISSEDESSASEEEGEKNDESVENIDADSNGGSSDRLQQEEGAGGTDPWDNGPVTPPLAPDPAPSTGRPRRTPSARLVDDSGLTRFVPQAEADDWSAALAVTAGQGPRSTGLSAAPQHAQGLALFETFFTHPPS